MSRSRHGGKGPGHEYWKSRWGKTFEDPGRWTKEKTHRKERRSAKHSLRDDSDESQKRAGGMGQ